MHTTGHSVPRDCRPQSQCLLNNSSDFAALILVAVGVAGLVLQRPGGSVLVCIAAACIMAGLLMLWSDR